jgi:hypothetical protein
MARMARKTRRKRYPGSEKNKIYIDEYGQLMAHSVPVTASNRLFCPYCQSTSNGLYCHRCGLDLRSKTSPENKIDDSISYVPMPRSIPDLPPIIPFHMIRTLASWALGLSISSMILWFISPIFFILIFIPTLLGVAFAISGILLGLRARKLGNNHPDASNMMIHGAIILGIISIVLNILWLVGGTIIFYNI